MVILDYFQFGAITDDAIKNNVVNVSFQMCRSPSVEFP